ncbi:MAG: hybrid sensor histidine kinase/response regulator [Pseudomonadota bacterium]
MNSNDLVRPLIDGRRTRILVVDDDVVLRKLAEERLSDDNHEIVLAEDGETAWNALLASPFDLALVDLSMPGMDGFSLIRKLREHAPTRHLPVIVITACDDGDSIDRAFEAGATALTVKPINWFALQYEIKFVLKSHAQEEELRQAGARAEAASTLKGSILSMIKHDISTPIRSIDDIAGGLAEASIDTLASRQTVRSAENILMASRRLQNRLADMLYVSRLHTGDIVLEDKLVSIGGVVADSVDEHLDEADAKRILIKQENLSSNVEIKCDERLIKRALGNILANAIKHNPVAEPIRVGTACHPNGSVAAWVRDHGPGIEPFQMAELMRPFSQMDLNWQKAESKSGLGLTAAKFLTELHGGRLGIQHCSTGGTLAAVMLPADRVVNPDGDPLAA